MVGVYVWLLGLGFGWGFLVGFWLGFFGWVLFLVVWVF